MTPEMPQAVQVLENAKWMVKPAQVALIISLLVGSEGSIQFPKALSVLFMGDCKQQRGEGEVDLGDALTGSLSPQVCGRDPQCAQVCAGYGGRGRSSENRRAQP